MMKMIRRVFCGIQTGLILLILFLVIFLIRGQAGGSGNWNYLVVLTGSMEPEIPTGSIVIIKSVPAESIGEGDIVTYKAHGSDEFVTHRIVAEKKSGYVTKGDANVTADSEPVNYADIQGKVQLTIPHLGKLLHRLRSVQAMTALVLTVLFLIILKDVVVYIISERYQKKIKQEE